MSSPSDRSRNISHPRKTKECSVGLDAWICSKALQRGLSFSPSWSVIKKVTFSYRVWEIPNVIISDKKLRHPYVSEYEPVCLAGIVGNHSLDFTNKFWSSFLIRKIRVRLPSGHTFVIMIGLIQLFSNPLHLDWHPNTLKYFVLALPCRMPNCTGCRFQISGLENGIRVVLSSQRVVNWLCCAVDKTWNNESACAKLIM